ncbi:MAG: TIGR03086 family metal-binding protein [Acidimicrobiia bacterium]
MSPSAQADNHRRVAGRFSQCVAHVGARWDDPTPVAEWTVRDIVRHLVEWLPGLLSSGSDVRLPAGPSVDDDPVGAWEAHRAAVQAVLDDPATAGKTLNNPHIGELPIADAIDRFYTADVFMHTWDIARATGQDDTLDAGTCESMLAGMASYEEAMRGSGQYGPRMAVADDAPAHERLAAFIGRDPNWRAG